ncbi:MAG: imidazole glycerol phosphate synthase subunit HisH [Chloroflexota bacterium]
MNLVVVDAGIGNLGAIPNMLKRVGATARISNRADDIAAADRLILPGVGAFDAAMRTLNELGIVEALAHKALVERVPVLGVCLGMQLLFRGSEEGDIAGLGWLGGQAVRFRLDGTDRSLRVPHMGWNYASPTNGSALLAGFEQTPRFYFAHSYHVECDDPADVAGWTTYGYRFASAVQHENIGGIQFHPEKSHRFGLKVFENFLAS